LSEMLKSGHAFRQMASGGTRKNSQAGLGIPDWYRGGLNRCAGFYV